MQLSGSSIISYIHIICTVYIIFAVGCQLTSVVLLGVGVSLVPRDAACRLRFEVGSAFFPSSFYEIFNGGGRLSVGLSYFSKIKTLSPLLHFYKMFCLVNRTPIFILNYSRGNILVSGNVRLTDACCEFVKNITICSTHCINYSGAQKLMICFLLQVRIELGEYGEFLR